MVKPIGYYKDEKGKTRPITKRKNAFGVPRELAYSEVESLRRQGKRARLIKTNTRLDLYAPYESVIPDKPAAAVSEPAVNASEPEKQETASHIGTIAQEKSHALKLIGLLNDNGKLQMSNEQLRDFFNDAKISVKNGEMHYMSVDPSHVVMIEETLPTSLPDGFYHIEQGENKSFTLESGVDPAAERFRTPQLDYSKNSWKAQIDGNDLVKLMDFLKKSSKDDPFSQTVTFRMNGNRLLVTGFNEKAAGRERELRDSHSPDENTVTILEMHAQPSGGPETNDGKWHTANFSRDVLGVMLKTMMARRSIKSDNGSSIVLNLREDYPLNAMTRRLGPHGEKVEAIGLIAPRME